MPYYELTGHCWEYGKLNEADMHVCTVCVATLKQFFLKGSTSLGLYFTWKT
jgi:hypothetical protein